MGKTAAAALLCLLLAGQEPVDSEVNEKIRREATENSRIMAVIHYLTDIVGARLTGSPQHRQAAEWAVQQASQWGLQNARLETWNFGRAGWSNQRAIAVVTAPFQETLVGRALAWTPSTGGRITGWCLLLIPPAQPTQSELTAWLEGQREAVRDRIVLPGRAAVVPVSFTPTPMRLDLDSPASAAAERISKADEADPILTAAQISAQIDAFLKEGGSLARLYDSARTLGQVRASQHSSYNPSTTLPSLVLRNEDYGRLARVLEDGLAVEMELEIANTVHPEGRTSVNVIAEIPGSDRAGEVVMLGGHLDSMHGAGGATDNASGVAVMMEAARILAAIGAPPRRSIRLALWGGEEQGLLGSQAYVQQRFGSAESQRAEFSRLSAYFNLDSGTGRIRAFTVFGPQQAADTLSQIVAPYRDLGVAGAQATRNRRLCCSDYTSFWVAGLPGITLVQDPIEYSATWHSNLDSYERIALEDLQQAAMVTASAVYHLAMRDQLLPRFPTGQLPPPGTAGDAPAGR